ncbi:MAG: hypothetical protein ACE5GK_04510 [Nitrospiria bacterium]
MTEKILIEKVAGGYIVSESNPDPKNPSELWHSKAVFSDFHSAMEEFRRRLRISDIIASEEGKFSIESPYNLFSKLFGLWPVNGESSSFRQLFICTPRLTPLRFHRASPSV